LHRMQNTGITKINKGQPIKVALFYST
jgi:hypothetical protein